MFGWLLWGAWQAWAGTVTVPRWGLELTVPDEGEWAVVDSAQGVAIRRDGEVRLVLEPVPNSGCGAAQQGAPALAGLDARWLYQGVGPQGMTWCLPEQGGTLVLRFYGGAVPDAPLVAIASQLAATPVPVTAGAPPAPVRPGYALLPYLTLRHWMPRRPTDIPGGLAVLRLDTMWEIADLPHYGGGYGFAWETHAFRGLAVGWETRLDAIPGNGLHSSVLYEGRALAGVGAWPVRWLGGAAYTGLGLDGVTVFERPSVQVPLEAVVLAGTARFGLEALARAELSLGPERGAIDTVGPFDATYARVAAWVGEKPPKEGDYCDYGYHSLWLGVFAQRQYHRGWIGATIGYGYTALPIR